MAAEVPVLESADKAAQPKPKGKRKLLVIIVAGTALVLTSAAVCAAWWLTASTHRAPATSSATPEKAAPPPAGPPVFLALDPPFVVNFDSEQAVRFLQITVQLESRDPATIEMLKSNDPVVRNDLLLLFGNQKYAQLATRDGKEALRNEALTDVRKVLEAAGGHPERLEAVYFTSFVMQ